MSYVTSRNASRLASAGRAEINADCPACCPQSWTPVRKVNARLKGLKRPRSWWEYNLAATARMLKLATQLGVPANGLFEVIGVSTGQSWMSDNFTDVQYDLLLKDVGLLRGEIGSLPATDLNDDVEQAILQARALLGSDSSNE